MLKTPTRANSLPIGSAPIVHASTTDGAQGLLSKWMMLGGDHSQNELHRPRARLNSQLAMGGSSRGEGHSHVPIHRSIRGYPLLG
ncbi:hypothetical protein A2U01_0005446 [Trifolium medium]|uniref:Uncharacterized protein n=1 Tax=Trifolium medium TaxID=97028 RepID=A0A392MEA9_9FABA|nr:hypothetical protein [Trifolium medium]